MFLNFKVWEEGGELYFHLSEDIDTHGTAVLWENRCPSLTELTNMRASLGPNSDTEVHSPDLGFPENVQQYRFG